MVGESKRASLLVMASKGGRDGQVSQSGQQWLS